MGAAAVEAHGDKQRMIKPKAIPGLPSNRKPSVVLDGPKPAPRRRRQRAKQLRREAKDLGLSVEELKEQQVRGGVD